MNGSGIGIGLLTEGLRAHTGSAALLQQIAPCGELRIGLMAGAYRSPFLVTIDPVAGEPWGVTVILANVMARALGTARKFVVHHSLSALEEGAASGSYDLTFMPMTAERKALLDFGPTYFRFANGMLVRSSSNFVHVDEVDSPGTQIAVQAGSVHHKQLARTLQHAQLLPVDGVDDIARCLTSGIAQVAAHATPVLATIQRSVADGRLLQGHISNTRLAVAVPRGRRSAFRFVRSVMRGAISSGLVAQAFREAGLDPDGSCAR